MQSLVDRRANGGAEGEDVKVICKAPNRKIYICSIDNHEIIDIPLVIARGVIQTTLGEVILILSYYTYYRKCKTIYPSS